MISHNIDRIGADVKRRHLMQKAIERHKRGLAAMAKADKMIDAIIDSVAKKCLENDVKLDVVD